MNKMKKIHIVGIIVCLIIATVLVITNQKKSTDYLDVVEEILEKEVQGIAFSLEDVVSLQGSSTITIDVDTETINGKLLDLEDQDYLIGTGIQLFKQLNYMEEVSMESNFKDTGYYLLSLNVDFTEGTNYDEPHKLALLIDKESHKVLVPIVYDIENPYNISFTNYRCFSPNGTSKEYINDIVKEVNAFILPAKEATYTFDQNYGATMVNLEYASKERVILRAEFGLFVYDLINEELIRSIDLNQINCDAIQGSNAAEILVNREGTIVQIHRMDSDKAYLYDVEKNSYTSSIFTPMENAFKLQDTYGEDLMDNGLVSSYCVRFGDDDYGYLNTDDYTVATLQYVRGDNVYYIFGE